MGVFEHYQERFDAALEEELSLQDYLELCKTEPSVYATAAERLLMAIGEPEFVDTSKDSRLSRIFSNKVIKRYPAFGDFYGMEESVEQIVSFFRHAAQGLEERKQILYLLGPVGGGKSSIAEKLKSLMQRMPFYAIKGSPINESPLGLFDPLEDGSILEEHRSSISDRIDVDGSSSEFNGRPDGLIRWPGGQRHEEGIPVKRPLRGK